MKHLTLLVKPASSLCNMRCRYCFYEDESENRKQKSMGIMTEDTMRVLLEKSMAYIGESGFLTVVFQGGEPTLAGAGYFRSFTELAEKLLPKGAGIQYSIQTNGYCISEELLAVLKKHRFLVGISLDGYRALHNSHRIDAAGDGTWHRILANLKRLQNAGIEVNALCVITAQAAGNAQKIYRTLKQLGFVYQQYILCLDPLGMERGSMPFSLTPESYGRFLKDAFDLWYADWKQGDYVSIRTFEDFVFNAIGIPCSSCAGSGKCGQYLLIEADGSVYPCDFFALDEWKLGNVHDRSVEELLHCETAAAFAGQRITPPEECAHCSYKTLCRTGCFRDWEPEGGVYHNHYCRSFQMLFAHALPRIREIASAEARSRRSR